MTDPFYGDDQAWIHDARFGDLARSAADLVVERLHAAGLHDGTVVDLGCGSGILAAQLVAAGYDVIGVDLSPAMLDLARVRAPGADLRLGSVHDFDPPAPLVAVTAIGEVLNYATDARAGLDACAALARRARDALVQGGVLLCDVATSGRYGSARTAERVHDGETWFLGMKAEESAGGTRLDRRITIFRDPDGGGRWHRVDEHHVLHLYEPAALEAVLADAGFTVEQRDRYSSASRSTPMTGWAVLVGTKDAEHLG